MLTVLPHRPRLPRRPSLAISNIADEDALPFADDDDEDYPPSTSRGHTIRNPWMRIFSVTDDTARLLPLGPYPSSLPPMEFRLEGEDQQTTASPTSVPNARLSRNGDSRGVPTEVERVFFEFLTRICSNCMSGWLMDIFGT